jgi:hypothetical protein
MKETIARITSTELGESDGPVFSAWVNVIYTATSGQGLGGYCFTDKPIEEPYRHRPGTAYGMEWIVRFLDAVGVSKWEDLPGTFLIVLRDDNDRVLGVKQIPTEGDGLFLFDDLPVNFGEPKEKIDA